MRASAYLRLYRVRDWLHFLALPVVGWLVDPSRPGLAALLGGTAGWGLGLAYATAINQAFDDRLDRIWRSKNPVGSELGRREAVLLSLPPLVGALALLVVFAPASLPAGIALVIAATLYSAPPRLKRFPVLGTMWNLLVGIPGFFFAGRPSLSEEPLRLFVGLFAVLLLGSQLIHEAQDRSDDVLGDVRTVATEGGRRTALRAACALVLVTPPLAWALSSGMERRVEITLACAAFAAAWG